MQAFSGIKMASSSYSEIIFEYNYISEPDPGLQCPICLDVAKDPLQHEECGKLFCKECMEKHGNDKPCPHCKTEGSMFYQDKKSKQLHTVLCNKQTIDCTTCILGLKDVLALRVKCNGVNGECKWEGTVSALEAHVVTCEFALVPCPNRCKGQNGRIKLITKKAVAEHLEKACPNRDYECVYCGEKGMYAGIDIHDVICEKKTLPCPNAECTDTIERQGIKRHLEECIYTEVPCKYQRLGCIVKMKRSDITVHEDDDRLHLHMALDTIATNQRKIVAIEENIGVIGVILNTCPSTN